MNRNQRDNLDKMAAEPYLFSMTIPFASGFSFLPPAEIHAFVDLRAGYRLKEDPYEDATSVMEARLQTEIFTYTDWAEFKYKGDVWADGVSDQGEYDTREAWVFARPADVLDIKIGRQVLTWGT